MKEPEEDILEIICDRVQSLNIALDEDMRLLGPVPTDLTAFEAMTEHGRVGSRALLKTVEQLEDQLMRLFRTILQARAVDTKDLYARDVANQMVSLRTSTVRTTGWRSSNCAIVWSTIIR